MRSRATRPWSSGLPVGTREGHPSSATAAKRKIAAQSLAHAEFRRQCLSGRLAWGQGRWHHATRNGRNGWWWDVGGVWYFYPEQIEGPPNYVSDIEVSGDATTELSDDATTASSPTPPKPHFVFYYRPGDFLGTRYQTFEECSQIREKAGNGVCVMK